MKKTLFYVIIFSLLLSGCSLVAQPKAIKDMKTQPADEKSTANDTSAPTDKKPVDNNIPASKKLDLSGQGLTKVPEYVFKQTGLEELNLSNNNLTGALPSQIGQLKNLKILDASNNQMTGVPAEVGQLSKLQVLNLSDNELTGLPNELANLKNLRTFNLSGNNYSEYDLDIIKKGLSADVNIIK